MVVNLLNKKGCFMYNVIYWTKAKSRVGAWGTNLQGEIIQSIASLPSGWRNVADNVYCYQKYTTSRELVTQSMQRQIVNALHLGERRKASSLLLELGHESKVVAADDFFQILRYCARSPDPLFAMETWRFISDKKIELNDRTCLLMVQALCKGGYLEEGYNLLRYLGEEGVNPILTAYNFFLRGCVKFGNMVYAEKCLDLMEIRLMGKNEATYLELLKLAVSQQNLSAVRLIWKNYTKHYNMGIIALRQFIWCFTRLKDLMAAYETLQIMVALAKGGCSTLKRAIKGRVCSSRLDIPVVSNCELDFGREILDHMQKSEKVSELETCVSDASLYCCEKVDNLSTETAQCATASSGKREVSVGVGNWMSKPISKVLRWSFSDVIHACAQVHNCSMAEQLIQQMLYLGMQPSSHTYDGFIRAVVSVKGFRDGMEVLKKMQESNLEPYDCTLATLSISCSRASQLDLAEALLDQISGSPSPRPYNAFLAACDAEDRPERAVKILAKMKELKIQPDNKTYELMFSLFGNVNAPYEEPNISSQLDAAKRVKIIESDMVKYGIQHSQSSIKNLLYALGEEGMVQEVIHYLRVAETLFSHDGIYLNTALYNTVLHSLVKARESQLAILIFERAVACGLPLDSATYTIMIDCCSILKSYKSACVLLSRMIRDGFLPETVTYTALIKVLLENEDFEEALNILDQAILEGNQLDVLLFNTILQKACEQGRVEVVEHIVEQMCRVNVQPDPSTCSFVFSAYVNQGFQRAALEALQVLSVRMIFEESNPPQEKLTEYEELILCEDSHAESRIVSYLNDKDNVAFALLNLRWCAFAGLSINWLPDQSPWVQRLSAIYES